MIRVKRIRNVLFSLGAHLDVSKPHLNLFVGRAGIHLGLCERRLFFWRPRWSTAYSVRRYDGPRLRIVEIAGPWLSLGFDINRASYAFHIGWWTFVLWRPTRVYKVS